MSDFQPLIYTDFINRRTGQTITLEPIQNNLTLTKDIRQLCDSFDFDLLVRLKDRIDLRSHDFVEFYFLMDGQRFQLSAGFLEDFCKEYSAGSARFQANGRDFLGQMFNLPFLFAKPFDSTTLAAFAQACVADAYLPEYLSLRGIARAVVPAGGYAGPVICPQLTDAKRGPVLQQTCDEVFTVPYQNRFGQLVLWGRAQLDYLRSEETLQALGDPNVMRFILRQNYSKVFSEVKVMYTGAEANVDYALTPSARLVNSDPRAAQIFQPEVRTFQTSSLITTQGAVGLDTKRNQFGASILRRSNQNLDAVVASVLYPWYQRADGVKVPYEVNQVWRVQSPEDGLAAELRIAGIEYRQGEDGLQTQLMLIGKDTLC